MFIHAQTSNSIFRVPLFCSFNLPLHVDEIVVSAMDKGLTVNASSGRFIWTSHMRQTSKIFFMLTSPKAPNHPTHPALSGSNRGVFEGAHPNLKLLKFGFRRIVLLHVLEWSHNSHILTLSPSVFSKKKHGYVFFSLFFPVVILSIFSSLTFFSHRFGVACWDRQDRDVNCNKSKASPEDDGQMISRGVLRHPRCLICQTININDHQWIREFIWWLELYPMISANSNQLLEWTRVLHQFLLRSVGHGFQGIHLNSKATVGSHQCCADETSKKKLKIQHFTCLSTSLCVYIYIYMYIHIWMSGSKL